jgi:hypothetical protein
MERIIVAWASLSRFYTNPTRYTIHKVKKGVLANITTIQKVQESTSWEANLCGGSVP